MRRRSVTVGPGTGITFTVETDGTGLNSGNATKAFVDLRIGIAGNDTNGIKQPHTFTITVEKNTGSGWVAFGAGAQPNVTLVDAAGAAHILDNTSTCDVSGDAYDGTGTNASGVCTVKFTSNTSGTVTGSATVTASVSGVSMTANTSDANASTGATVLRPSSPASFIWHKNDNNAHRLGGATFEVCRTTNYNSATDAQDAITPVCVTVLDDSAPDVDSADGDFMLVGLVLGTYTVRETIAPAGYHIDNPNAVNAGSMTTSSPNLEITTPFVNSKAFRLIAFTCDDITHTLVVSTITQNTGGPVVKSTISSAAFAALGWKDANGVPLTEAALCGFPGANFGPLNDGTYNVDAKIPE